MPELTLPEDVTLHYEVDGSGPPLLLLAGMMGDSAGWAALLPHLTPHFTVVRPDNRSTGRTRPWNAEASLQIYARDAAALMAELGFDRYDVCGHSMGGLIAMELCGLRPDAVRRICILASAPVRVPRTMAVFDSLLAVRSAPEGETLWLRALYPWLFAPAFFAAPGAVEQALTLALGYPHAQGRDAMAHQIEVLRSYRPTIRAADVTCPVLTVFAGDDLLIPEEAGRAAFAAMPDVTQTTLPDAGHSLHWDKPAEVADLLTDFLRPGK